LPPFRLSSLIQHPFILSRLEAVGQSSAGKVVRAEFYCHLQINIRVKGGVKAKSQERGLFSTGRSLQQKQMSGEARNNRFRTIFAYFLFARQIKLILEAFHAPRD
jgi:hypothetical protein